MKFPFLPGLVLATGLCLAPVLPCGAQAPSPSPGSFPGPAPTRPPDVPRDPPFPLPPPQPERVRPPTPLPPAVGFRSHPPSAAERERAIPHIEIWRAGSNLPQQPKGLFRNASRVLNAALAGNEPVTIRLRFHPLSRGKAILVKSGRGITLSPSSEVLIVPPDGQLLVAIALDPTIGRSQLSFTCEGLTSTLILSRTSPDIVAARENTTGEGAQ